MKTDRLPLIIALLVGVASVLPSIATGSISTSLSNSTIVDTRDLFPITDFKMTMRDVTQADGRRMIRSQSQKISLTRKADEKVTYYLQLKVPDFFTNGWAIGQTGIGTFYGLEIAWHSLSEDSVAKSGDLIYFKYGGDVPNSATPVNHWTLVKFDNIIDTTLQEGTYYFKVVVNRGAGPVILNAFHRSLRFCDSAGSPVTKLNSQKPIWLLAHGKNDGESTFQKMNAAVRKGTGAEQVVEVDWASGADGSITDLSAGRYFINLGRNLSGVILDHGFVRKNVNWIGHSWGTYVGYEAARQCGGMNRFFALDPARKASLYDESPDFGDPKISLRSTSIRGGDDSWATFGSDKLAGTANFSIRLLSEEHTGLAFKPLFYHNLPRDWFIRAMSDHKSDVYWPFLHEKMMRTQVEPAMPNSWGGFVSNGLSGFDIECHGATINKSGTNVFAWHDFLVFKNEKRKQMEARARKSTNGSLDWSVKSH